MKKMSKTLGTLAASAALAFGCAMPAFAATATASDDLNTMSGTNGTGETAVKAYVVESQISATVPVTLYVVTPNKGGALTCPTNYAITNTGEDALTVSNVKATSQGGWEIAEPKTYVTGTPGSDELAWPEGKSKQVKMDFKTTGASFSLQDASGDAGKTLTLGINAGEAATFALSGTSNVKDNLTAEADVAQAMAKLVYTIA